MKNMKKFAGLLLALIMVLSVVSPVAADTPATQTTHTLIIKNEVSGHNYEAYQIFAGDYVEKKVTDANGETTTQRILSDITWGTGVNSEYLLTALVSYVSDFKGQGDEDDVKPFANCTTAAQVAEVIAGLDAGQLDAVAKIIGENLSATKATGVNSGDVPNCVSKFENLASGYYLVKDVTNPIPTGDSATKFILEVVDDVEVKAKDDTVTVDKFIKKQNGEEIDLVHADDYNVGDTVNFRIFGKIPAMDGYDSYEYIIHDTASEGITPVLAEGSANVAVKVYIVEAERTQEGVLVQKENTTATELTNDGVTEYSFVANEEGENYTFKLKFDNILSHKSDAGKYIMVEYSGILNENALTTKAETNETFIEYSNNPNDEGTGTTTEDQVFVFDFDININKYANEIIEDGENTMLADADFVLYRLNGESKAEFYKYTEPTETEGGKVTWVEVTGFTHSDTVKANDAVIAAAYGVKATEDTDAKDPTITLKTTNTEGNVRFDGLDAGTYYLLETDAPEGYNTLEGPVEVVIAVTYTVDENGATIAEDVSVTGAEDIHYDEAEDGTETQPYADKNIINKSGLVLPSTGGMGTTLFYAIGGALMLYAVVALVTKKRVGDAK